MRPATSKSCADKPGTVAGNLCSTTGEGWWAAPGLDPATASFQPAAGSPLVGKGLKQHASATDLFGVARGESPAAGAVER